MHLLGDLLQYIRHEVSLKVVRPVCHDALNTSRMKDVVKFLRLIYDPVAGVDAPVLEMDDGRVQRHVGELAHVDVERQEELRE